MKKKQKSNKYLKSLKNFWDYIWNDDSFGSYVANFLVAILLIKFIIFPILGLAFNTEYPVVAIVSGSMEHKIVDSKICDKGFVDITNKDLDFDNYWNFCGNYYEEKFNLTSSQFKDFDYDNGLNIGDMMVLYGKSPEKIKLGEVLVFIPGDKNFYKTKGPVIHRVVKIWTDENGKYHYKTKGDHNAVSFNNFEEDITEDRLLGVAVFRIPYLGYIKVAINNGIMYIQNEVLN